MDGAKLSSWVARICAAIVVVSLLLVTPVMLDMYMTTSKNNKITEINNEKLNQRINLLDKKLKELDGQTD